MTLKLSITALLLVLFGAACADDKKPDWLCSQEIPGTKLSLFRYRFDSEWATTSETMGYAIDDAASKIRKVNRAELPEGDVLKIEADGTIHLANFAPAAPSSGDKTIHHVVGGVPVVETVFNAENGWWRGVEHRFERVEAAGDRIAFIGVKDEAGNPVGERVEVSAGGIIAQDKDGVVQSLALRRVEPRSPTGTKHRLFYDTYLPAEGVTIRLEQLPSRGICKRVSPAKR
jgi:hypothetical protein